MFSKFRFLPSLAWRRWLPLIALLAPLLLLLGCQSEMPPGVRRVALVPFEYQGANSEDRWLADALESAAGDQMRGVAGVIPLRAADANAAAAQGATEVVRGMVSGGPEAVRLQLYAEEVATGRVRLIGGKAPDAGVAPVAMNALLPRLRALLAEERLAGAEYSTKNPDAFAAFGKALRTEDPSQGIVLLQQAVSADPAFTSAALRLAALFQRAGQPERAVGETERLMGALPVSRTLDRAYAALQLATLRGSPAAIEKALGEVVAASPGDLEAAIRLATVLQQRRNYTEAAKVLRQVAGMDSRNGGLWNQIAYAEAFSGKRDAAMQALAEYRRLSPEDPNVDDTSGDVLYFFGAFLEAAGRYDLVHMRNPQWQGGFPLLKAAWARLYGGDLSAADAAMEKYLGVIRPENAPLADLRGAQWQFLRGQRSEARSKLKALLGQPSLPRPYRGLLASQLYVWDLAEGKLGELEGEFRGGKPRYGTDVTSTVGALFQSARPGQTPAQRAQAISGFVRGPAPPALVAAAIFLDAQERPPLSAEGMQALVLADQAIPEPSAVFTHTVAAWGFLERGEPGEAAKLFARRVAPVASDDGLLWPLLFPDCLRWELEAWSRAGQKPPLPHFANLSKQLLPGAEAAP